MRGLATLTAAVALVAAFGFVGAANATHPGPLRYADSVASFATDEGVLPGPHGPNAGGQGCDGDSTGIELNALGAEDAAAINCGIVGTISLGTGTTLGTGSITVEFTDNVALPDGTGTVDLTVYDGHSTGVADETALVSVSADGVNFIGVGTAINNPAASSGPFANNFDLDPTGLPFVKFVRIINQSGSLGSPGFDVDAVEALNSAIPVTMDIKLWSDPNGYNCKKKGVLPVTIFGTATFDVTDINVSTLELTRFDGGIGDDSVFEVGPPVNSLICDRGGPGDAGDDGGPFLADCFAPFGGGNEDTEGDPDGELDIDVRFVSRDVADLIGCSGLSKGAASPILIITGELNDGTPIISVPTGDSGADRLTKVNRN